MSIWSHIAEQTRQGIRSAAVGQWHDTTLRLHGVSVNPRARPRRPKWSAGLAAWVKNGKKPIEGEDTPRLLQLKK